MNTFFVPFRAIRYNLPKIQLAEVATPPYDVISSEEREKFYQKSPYNMVRLDFGKPLPGDSDQDNRYTRAAHDFKEWLGEGILMRDAQPAFYLYEQLFQIEGKQFTRRGLFGLRFLESFGTGKIFPHEKTIAGPKADRLLLMKSCGANFSSIFGIYSDPDRKVSEVLAPLYQRDPLAHFEQDGVVQRLWMVSEPEVVAKISGLLSEKSIVIADGHHRYETALTYRDWRLAQEPHAPESAPFRYVLMYLADRDESVVQPTHRVVHNTPGFDRRKLEARLNQVATVTACRADELFQKLVSSVGNFGCRFGVGFPEDEFLLVEITAPDIEKIRALEEIPAALRSLDVAVSHKLILEDLLGLSKTEQTDPHFVEFVKSRAAALEALRDPGVQCVLLMTPPDLAAMERVVQAGLTMPPKTTYFYPKLLTGLVINQF